VNRVLAAALLSAALAFGCARAQEPAAPSNETLAAGERAFQKCYACHSVDPADKGADGPGLRGIVGRKIASSPGYAYSDAMRIFGAGGKTWTRQRLDAYIADPQAVVPHNAMAFFGIPDEKERAALIAWLAEQR
jgi:cytochrome c